VILERRGLRPQPARRILGFPFFMNVRLSRLIGIINDNQGKTIRILLMKVIAKNEAEFLIEIFELLSVLLDPRFDLLALVIQSVPQLNGLLN
jgi:hypothetical protein